MQKAAYGAREEDGELERFSELFEPGAYELKNLDPVSERRLRVARLADAIRLADERATARGDILMFAGGREGQDLVRTDEAYKRLNADDEWEPFSYMLMYDPSNQPYTEPGGSEPSLDHPIHSVVKDFEAAARREHFGKTAAVITKLATSRLRRADNRLTTKVAVDISEAHSLLRRRPGSEPLHPALYSVNKAFDAPADRAMVEDVLGSISGYESVDEGGIPLRVNVGRTQPFSDALRVLKNKRLGAVERTVKGGTRLLFSPLSELGSRFAGEAMPVAHYDPDAHSITLSGGGAPVLLHELGHAVDIPDRIGRERYMGDPSGYEVRATRYANQWLTEYGKKKGMKSDEVEQMRRGLDAAFDTYALVARIGPSAFDTVEDYDDFRKTLLRKSIDRHVPSVADRDWLLDIVDEVDSQKKVTSMPDRSKRDKSDMRKAAAIITKLASKSEDDEDAKPSKRRLHHVGGGKLTDKAEFLAELKQRLAAANIRPAG